MPGRADLQRVGALDRVGHVEHRGDRAADRRRSRRRSCRASRSTGSAMTCRVRRLPPTIRTCTSSKPKSRRVGSISCSYLVKGHRPYANDNTKGAGACPLSTEQPREDVARNMAAIRRRAQAVLPSGRGSRLGARGCGGSPQRKRRAGQEHRPAAGRQRLGLVAGRRPVGGRLAPVRARARPARRSAARPEPPPASSGHSPASSVASRSSPPGPDHAGELGQTVSALTIRRLWWRSFGQGSGNRTKARSRLPSGSASSSSRASSIRMRTLLKPLVLDGAQQLGDAVDERLDAQKADIADGAAACAARCSPPPKPISSQSARGGVGRGASGSTGAPGSSAKPTRGSTLVQQPPGTRPQLGALAAAVEDPPRGRVARLPAHARQLKARRSSAARSVRSHEKPPSSSAARPKWP